MGWCGLINSRGETTGGGEYLNDTLSLINECGSVKIGSQRKLILKVVGGGENNRKRCRARAKV